MNYRRNLSSVIMLACILLGTASGCNTAVESHGGSIKIIDTPVSVLSDGSFLGNYVSQIEKHDQYIYLNDATNSRIIKLRSDDLSIDQVIGSKGTGPGEFSHVAAFSLTSDYVYAYDGGSRNIYVFNENGGLENTISIGSIVRTSFIVNPNDTTVAYSTSGSESAVTVMNVDGKIIREFGEGAPSEQNDLRKRFRSRRHLALRSPDELISVGSSIPIVEIYSLKDGALLRRLDLSSLEQIRSRMEYAEAEYGRNDASPTRTAVIFQSISVLGNRLYIAAITGYPGNNLSGNLLLEIDVDMMALLNSYRFPFNGSESPWVTAVSVVSKDTLIYYEAKSASLTMATYH